MVRRFLATVTLLVIGAITVAAQSPPTLRIETEVPGLPSQLFYGTVKVKPVRLRPGTNIPITIADNDFFVQTLYNDNLFRFPDAPGFAHWHAEITKCTTDPSWRLPGETEAQCIDRKRDNTAAAFFFAPELQYTLSYMVRVYWGSLGKNDAAGTKCIVGEHSALDAVCRPLYSQFITDHRTLTTGIVVNNALDAARINSNKKDFANAFVNKAEFIAVYPTNMTAQAYIDALEARTGVPLTAPEEAALISDFNSPGASCTGLNSGRSCVLFKMVDGANVIAEGNIDWSASRYGKAFYDQTFNSVFVFTEYLIYLRRNPDKGGFDFWLNKMNTFGNWLDAQMVRSFIVSPEYINRF